MQYNMRILSTNIAKTLVWRSQCDVTNSAYPVTMTMMRHCPSHPLRNPTLRPAHAA